MRAARLHEFGQPLRIDELADPEPGAGEAIVEVAACGVNRVDAELVQGEYGGEPISELPFGQMIQELLPLTPGIETAGTVATVGPGVEDWSPGDRVLVHSASTCGRCRFCRSGRDNYCAEIQTLGVGAEGGYCERYRASAGSLVRLPDEVGFVTAAAIETNFGTAWEMIRRAARTGPEDTVLVIGSTGGVGHACVQVAKLCGARVIAVGGSADKLAAVEALGADEVVDASATPSFSDAVLAATGGAGVDVVAESVGAATWPESVKSAGRCARFVVGGAHAGAVVPLDLGPLFALGWEVHGITRAPRFAMADCVRLVAEGRLEPHVHATFPLDRVNEALDLLVARGHVGKVVIEPQEK